MRLASVPESLYERIGLTLGLVPTPFLDTLVALMLARTLMTAVKHGIFGVVARGRQSADKIAEVCDLDVYATRKLLRALEGAGYLRRRHDNYELTRVAQRWLTPGGAKSFSDGVLHRYLDAGFMNHYDDYVTKGRAADFHKALTPEQWNVYERGQRSHAALMAKEVAWRLPVSRQATALLDVGGGHGLYSIELCRRHPRLLATILDLPGAAFPTASCLSAICIERIEFRAGDVLVDDLGFEAFDVILLANVLHHFTAQDNAALVRRVSRALRTGGVCAILDLIRTPPSQHPRQIEALMDFYFAAASAAGIWTEEDLSGWQRAAGMKPLRLKRLWSVPECGLQIARKENAVGN
jgi:2-polyprenyl-3-methyl-5-hydroxy-6-metoxy-1,4-benzoquinol methylase